MRRSLYAVLPLAAAALALPLAPALAEGRDPAYAAARAAGQVGEKIDGYLGVVGASTPALAHMVADLNIKRKAVYADRAQVQHSTLEEYAFTSGCHLILQTEPGEKYQAPDGTWHTRTDAPPLRHSRCP